MRKLNLLFIMVLLSCMSYAQSWTVYEADALPEDTDLGFDNSNENGDAFSWEIIADPDDATNNLLEFKSPGTADASAMKRHKFDPETPDAVTIVIRAKLIDEFERAVEIDLQMGGLRDQLRIESDEITLQRSGAGIAIENLNGWDPAEWNTYRFTLDANTGEVNIYVNETDTAALTATTTTESSNNYFRFGDGAGSNEYASQIDYIAWTTGGAFGPSVLSYPSASSYEIVFITDDEKDEEQINFLRLQGFKVTPFWPGALSEVEQDTLDYLDAADLIIIGRSPGSGTFETPDKEFWNAITAPIISNNQYGSRSSRINWFNSTTAFHSNDGPDPFNAFIHLPEDTIFSRVELTAEDSLDFYLPPHDFLSLEGNETNAELVATNDTIVVIARFETGVEFYPDAGESPAGPRTYFGFGNDNTDVINYFPLTDNGKAVYLAEIQRTLGLAVTTVKESSGDIIFVHAKDNVNEDTGEPRDQPFIDKLRDQGYVVTERYEEDFFALTEDQLTEYNDADLVVIGRSGSSGDFRDNNKQAWNRLSSPVMLMSPFAARNSRLDWFNSSSVSSDGLDDIAEDSVIQAVVLDDADAAFAGVEIPAEGNIDWFIGPYRTLYFPDSLDAESNADLLVVINDNPEGAGDDKALLMARFDAGEVFYSDTEAKGGGPRSYFGLGHDDNSYYNLSAKAEQIWLNEVDNLINLSYTPVDLPSANSTLAELNVGESLVGGFNLLELNYDVEVEGDEVPTVTATATDEAGADVTITPATEIPGSTTVDVVAADGVSALTYTVNFTSATGGGGDGDFKVVYVGNSTADASGEGDALIIDTLEAWGFTVDYVDHEAYEGFNHTGYTLTYLSESVSSANTAPFAAAGYPTPVLIAEPYGLSADRLNIGSINSETAQVAVVQDMKILDDEHVITAGIWAANETVQVFDNTKTTWDVFQYEVEIDGSLKSTNLGQGDGYTGFSWVAIEPSGVLNERAVVLAFHDGVSNAGTADYWKMLRQSTLWLLDSLGGEPSVTSSALDIALNIYPNPSNQITTVEYTLEDEGNVSIDLLNASGQLVNMIDEGFKKSGKNRIRFNSAELKPGIFILRIRGENFMRTSKIFVK